MTLLQLVNNVLTRLREEPTTQETLVAQTDVYINFIVTAVNDAKDRVEDSWQWSALRGATLLPMDTPTATPPLIGSAYELPDSADNHYILKGFYGSDSSTTSYYGVRQISRDAMIRRYASGDNTPVGKPAEVAVNKRAQPSGNIQVLVYPLQKVGTTAQLYVDHIKHQEELVPDTVNLLVPSLPVYTLATALASRERGEVGGTPTSELFAIADRHLSDAIAQDSALYADEMIWYSAGEGWVNTNVKSL